MNARGFQLMSRMIGAVLTMISTWIGVEAMPGETQKVAVSVGTGIFAFAAFVIDLFIHKAQTGAISANAGTLKPTRRMPLAAMVLLPAVMLALVGGVVGGCGVQNSRTPGGVRTAGSAALSVFESEETGINYSGETSPVEFDSEDASYFGPVPPTLFVVNPETGKIVYVGTENLTADVLDLERTGDTFTLHAEMLGTDRSAPLLAIVEQINALTAQVEANAITQQRAIEMMESIASDLTDLARVLIPAPGIPGIGRDGAPGQ